jgi:hypothetical protein
VRQVFKCFQSLAQLIKFKARLLNFSCRDISPDYMLAEKLQYSLMSFCAPFDYAFDYTGCWLVDDGSFKSDTRGDAIEFIFGEVRQCCQWAFDIDSKLDASNRTKDASLYVSANSATRSFLEIGYLVTERFQLCPFIG